MQNEKNPTYTFWNGKNINGKQQYYDLINEGARDGKTESKYDVCCETIAADDL